LGKKREGSDFRNSFVDRRGRCEKEGLTRMIARPTADWADSPGARAKKKKKRVEKKKKNGANKIVAKHQGDAQRRKIKGEKKRE